MQLISNPNKTLRVATLNLPQYNSVSGVTIEVMDWDQLVSSVLLPIKHNVVCYMAGIG